MRAATQVATVNIHLAIFLFATFVIIIEIAFIICYPYFTFDTLIYVFFPPLTVI